MLLKAVNRVMMDSNQVALDVLKQNLQPEDMLTTAETLGLIPDEWLAQACIERMLQEDETNVVDAAVFSLRLLEARGTEVQLSTRAKVRLKLFGYA